MMLWFAFRNRTLPLRVHLHGVGSSVHIAASAAPGAVIAEAILGPLIPRDADGIPLRFAVVEAVRAQIRVIDYTPKDASQIRAQALIMAASIDYATLYGQPLAPVDIAFAVMLIEEALPEMHVGELIHLLLLDQMSEKSAQPLAGTR